MFKLLLFTSLGMLYYADLFAQPDHYFLPNPRPKFFQASFRSVSDFTLSSVSRRFGDSQAKVDINQRLSLKLDAPLFLGDQHQLLLGLRASKEEFEFDDIQQVVYPLYQRLEDKNLFSVGARLLYRKKLPRDRQFVLRLGADLNGDVVTLNQLGRFFKGDFLGLYLFKPNPRTEIGFGGGFSYNLGVPLAYPIFIYHRNLARNWCLNLDLPRSVEIQYAFSEKMYAYATVEISGASYRVIGEVLPDISDMELRYSELGASFRLEREIYDWIWARLDIGAIRNLNLFLSRPRDRKADNLVESLPFSARYLHVSLFLVPPRKWLKNL